MPAKKKKKATTNGFSVYMRDIMPDLRREGRVFPNGMADVVPIALPRWKNLPEAERNRYEEIAKREKKKNRGPRGDDQRYDNVGNIISKREDPVVEEGKRRIKERKIAKSRWPPDKEIMEEKFYFISVEYLCLTEDGQYLPCEIGMVEWCMKHGITKTFHKFIQHGGIPLGYRYACQSHSEERHQIPVDGFELAESNYRGIYIQMKNFINPGGEKQEYPPIYCMSKDMKCVEFSVDWIFYQACMGLEGNALGKVYFIEDMVLDLYQHCGASIAESEASVLLETTSFDYEPKTTCIWHEQKGIKFCALGTCKRYAYALSDAMCCLEGYEFELTPSHLPTRTEEEERSFTVLPSHAVGMEPPSSRYPEWSRGDEFDGPSGGNTPWSRGTEGPSGSGYREPPWARGAEPEGPPGRASTRGAEPQRVEGIVASPWVVPEKEASVYPADDFRYKSPDPEPVTNVGGFSRFATKQSSIPKPSNPEEENFGSTVEPDIIIKSAQSSAGQPPQNLWNRKVNPNPSLSSEDFPALGTEDFPSLGASSRDTSSTENPKFASRACPPPPEEVPHPSAWHTGSKPPGIGRGGPRGVGQIPQARAPPPRVGPPGSGPQMSAPPGAGRGHLLMAARSAETSSTTQGSQPVWQQAIRQQSQTRSSPSEPEENFPRPSWQKAAQKGSPGGDTAQGFQASMGRGGGGVWQGGTVMSIGRGRSAGAWGSLPSDKGISQQFSSMNINPR